jgi:hypothetical protein
MCMHEDYLIVLSVVAGSMDWNVQEFVNGALKCKYSSTSTNTAQS